jgi:hypothetical protein
MEQDLVHVDVAEPGDAPLVHEERLDARPPPAREGEERSAVKPSAQRIDAVPRFVPSCLGRHHGDPPEATRVVEREEPPVVELDHHVVVHAVGPRAARERELAGHSEMHEPDGPVVEPSEQVLAAAVEADDPAPAEPRGEFRRDAAAEPPLAQRDRDDAPADELPRERADDGLDLGQLGHALGLQRAREPRKCRQVEGLRAGRRIDRRRARRGLGRPGGPPGLARTEGVPEHLPPLAERGAHDRAEQVGVADVGAGRRRPAHSTTAESTSGGGKESSVATRGTRSAPARRPARAPSWRRRSWSPAAPSGAPPSRVAA